MRNKPSQQSCDAIGKLLGTITRRWTLHIIWKLLHNDPGMLSLLGNNPFPDKQPRFIRAQLYRYKFAPPGNAAGAWWNRELIGPWLPPLSTDDRIWAETRRAFGWPK